MLLIAHRWVMWCLSNSLALLAPLYVVLGTGPTMYGTQRHGPGGSCTLGEVCVSGYFQNAPGGLCSALRAWVRAMGRGTIEPRRLRKLLGQLCWLSRPNARLFCFMAGSYQALNLGARWFTRSMARGLGTVLLFSDVAQSYPLDAHEGGMQQVLGKRDLLLLADAAPDGERLRVGLVGDRRFRRSIRCIRPVGRWRKPDLCMFRGGGMQGLNEEQLIVRLRLPTVAHIGCGTEFSVPPLQL